MAFTTGRSRLMTLLLAVLFLLGLFAPQISSTRLIPSPDDESMARKHEEWMAQYGRVYKDEVEKGRRFKIFKENVEYIESANKLSKGYRLAVNAFADLTNAEFLASRTGYKRHTDEAWHTKQQKSFMYENFTALPASIDWRKKGAVTPIKDQGQCGSCWTFSTVASVEGIHQITTGKLVSLSEQEIVDCDFTANDQGCDGGFVDDAFQYIIKNKGITTEANYPYKAVDGKCNKKKASQVAASITGYQDVPANNEAALQKAVAHQPVSVAIDASGDGFQFYSSGVYTGSCGTELDHAVTVVGYGIEDGIKFWLVKNSWGTSWGDKGYIKMQRGIAARHGICGIAMSASYPIASRC